MSATTHPLISILMPTYNRAYFLGEAIQSALAQTYPNLEILVLDDTSPDNTPEVVAPFTRDPRLRYIRHPQNKGLYGNWRAGLEQATGEYICFLEDDDRFHPEFVERMMAPLLADPELDLTFCDHLVIDAEGQLLPEETEAVTKRFGRDRLSPGRVNDLARVALVDKAVGLTSSMFRRRCLPLDCLDERARGGNDLYLYYHCVRSGRVAFYLPDRLMDYRVHGAGMSASMPRFMALGHIFVYEQIQGDPTLAPIHADVRAALHDAHRSLGLALLSAPDTADPDEARRHLRKALRLRFSPHTVAGYLLSCMGGHAGALLNQARGWKRRRRGQTV